MQKFKHDGKTRRCQKDVMRYIGNWPKSGQCEFAAKDGTDFCKIHHPDAEAKRDAEVKARYDVQWAKRRKEIHGASFFAVLEKIAAGHNDPRTLAQEAIDKFNGKD